MNIFDERPVLIVDDSQIYRTSAARMLTKLGLPNSQIVLSADSKQALSACRRNQFQLVLIDYNLGTQANGYQLLDDIKSQQLLPPDCVVVVITGDASADIVKSFAELEPDSYLIKPLSFNTLKERVPKLLEQKRALSSILWAIKDTDYDNGLEACEEVMFDCGDTRKHAALLKVQILLLKGDMDSARNLLVSLNSTISTDVFSAKLAEIAIAKRQYSMAEYVLTSHLKRSPESAKELTLLGELYLLTGKVTLAQEAIINAISLSPTVVKRHWLLLCCYLINQQHTEAIKCVNEVIHHSLYSSRHSLTAYQLGASIVVDSAMKCDFDKREAAIRELKGYLEQWRKRFNSREYKPFELLVMARAYFAVGLRGKGLSLLEEYKQLKERVESNPLEIVEMIKISHQVGGIGSLESLIVQFDQSIGDLATDTHAVFPESMRGYLAIWRTEFNSALEHYQSQKRRVMIATESGQYEVAAELLVDMFYAGVELTLDVPRRLLHTLSKAWPSGMCRIQVVKVATKCKESLIGADNFPTDRESQILATLARQLDYPELNR
ncbi:response regulator [Vibrio bivalvicida]|uniref:Response regulator n=1 Tax=Vibrio bivalvicida TaxID=1276888 RepID=A0ABV4MI54_9VIBR